MVSRQPCRASQSADIAATELMNKVLCLCVLFLTGAAAQTACAQNYPASPIRMIVPFPAGGNTDIVARAVGNKLSEYLGQSVIIENRGGAGGALGSEFVARSMPDGYTLLMVSASHVINPSMVKKLPYDTVKDFAPISLVADVPAVLVVHPSLPAKTLKELIAIARAHPAQLNYASSGNGTVGHLSGELLKSMAKIKMEHVPYKGNAPAMTDLLGGHTQLTFSSMPSAMPHIKTGRLRALAMTGARRSSAAPDIPTMIEAGLPGFEVSSGFGLLAAAGTPRNIISRLNAQAVKSLQVQEVRERLASQGAEPVGNTPEQYDTYVRAEIAKWAKLVQEAGIRPES